jgi:hypothetical protein
MSVTRMWKGEPIPAPFPFDGSLRPRRLGARPGYRNARIAWHISEDTLATPGEKGRAAPLQPKRVAFLIIFAPRRGLLEAWNVPHGARAAAFNVGVGSKLLPPNDTTARHASVRAALGAARGVWLLRPDGRLYALRLPAACAQG